MSYTPSKYVSVPAQSVVFTKGGHTVTLENDTGGVSNITVKLPINSDGAVLATTAELPGTPDLNAVVSVGNDTDTILHLNGGWDSTFDAGIISAFGDDEFLTVQVDDTGTNQAGIGYSFGDQLAYLFVTTEFGLSKILGNQELGGNADYFLPHAGGTLLNDDTDIVPAFHSGIRIYSTGLNYAQLVTDTGSAFLVNFPEPDIAAEVAYKETVAVMGGVTASGTGILTSFTFSGFSGYAASIVQSKDSVATVLNSNISGDTLTVNMAAAPILGTNNIRLTYVIF